MKQSLFIILLFVYQLADAQNSIDKVNKFRAQHETAILKEYFNLLSIPNYALDKVNIDKNALFIEAMLKKRGIETKLLESNTKGSPKAVYGEVMVPGATQTIIFYAHYDGQAVNPEKWHPSIKPYQPVLLDQSIEKSGKIIAFPANGQAFNPEWRISCRSSSDDKAGVMTLSLIHI